MNKTHTYMMLSRLQADCRYYLGWGNRNPKILWAQDEEAQIREMTRLYDSLDEKPKWLTKKEIAQYQKGMCSKK